MKYLKSVLLIVLLALVFDPRYVFADEAQWVTKNSLPKSIMNMGVITVNGDMYRMGGFEYDSSTGENSDRVYKYDPINDAWIPKASMNVKRYNFAAAESGGKIYVFGGQQKLGKSVEEYDPKTDVWTIKADMPTARLAMSAASVNGKIYVISGIVGDNNALSSVVEEYNPNTNTWTKKKNISTNRFHYGIGVYHEKIYIIGGYTDGTKRTDKIEIYDPISDIWATSSAVSPSLLIGAFGSATYEGDFYFIGLGGSFIFSPSTGTWANIPALPKPVESSGIGVIDGKLYSISGASNSKSIYEYTLEKSDNPGTDPEPEPSGSRAILTVTMNTGLEKEFDLSMEEVNAFINWYDTKEAGSGAAKFAIDKHSNNKGPFSKRSEYIIFKNILSFEVDEYSTVTNATYK